MNRNISRDELRKAAQRVLEFLQDSKISSVKDLEGIVGKTKILGVKPIELIEISLAPSNLRTNAYTINYATPPKGIPLTLKINASLGYAQVIAKGSYMLPGYKDFAKDPFGNTTHYKAMYTTDLAEIKRELEHLAED